jgi:ATP-dependent helicase/nuclease subunit A
LGFTPSKVRNAEAQLIPNARRRGILIHKLLEYLPDIAEEQRSSKAQEYLKTQALEFSADEQISISEAAIKTLNLLDISPLFSKVSRAEIDIAGDLERDGKPPREVIGTIDRIAVTEDTVFIGDFKTTASPPRSPEEVPDHTVAQLAVYGSLASGMFPDKKIRCFVIYTEGPEAIELPIEILNRALSIIE